MKITKFGCITIHKDDGLLEFKDFEFDCEGDMFGEIPPGDTDNICCFIPDGPLANALMTEVLKAIIRGEYDVRPTQ